MEDKNITLRNLVKFELLVKKTLSSWDDYEFFLEYIVNNINNYLKSLTSFEGYVKNKLLKTKKLLFAYVKK